jgi:non-canonical purine NTP pyrophosphatase (RdgB/HAM1 family)
VENANTFDGNARKKADALAAVLRGGPEADWLSVADDSGLCVDALDGRPGVTSARFAGEGARDADNTARLLRLLADVPPKQRSAAFHCTIVAVRPDGTAFAFEGRCPGRILGTPRGVGGFGYDPVFVPVGRKQTFAELASEVKNRISHRARAIAAFATWLRAEA